jgi:hypothetical protein
MTALMPTQHGAVRMAQRGIPARDAELIALIGTEVGDGYLVRCKDVQAAEREIKHLLARIRRLEGKRLVTADGRIITAYQATRRQQRGLLRRAHESDLRETDCRPRRKELAKN